MSFPWWEAPVPEDYRATFPQKFETMLVDETRRRAQILHSLGYEHAEALLRVRVYLRWDYELHGLPRAAGKLEGVVGEVYGRRTAAAPKSAPPAAKAAAGKAAGREKKK